MKISILSVCVEMITMTCSAKLIARVEILKDIIFAQGQTNDSRNTLIVEFRVQRVRLKGETGLKPRQKLSHGKLNERETIQSFARVSTFVNYGKSG